MSFDSSRIDLLIQYALLVAGEEDDPFDRQLGPIHLIKYVYLGDLAYASRNAGTTFTGVEWKFHKFGPWSQVVNERIEPALRAVGADQRIFESDYEEKSDWVRWSLSRAELLQEKERALPPSVALRLRPEVRKFGKDTAGLLDYVYRTPPMLEAAPGERLDLHMSAQAQQERANASRLKQEDLSEKKKKAFRDRMNLLQQTANSRARRGTKLINPVEHPRLDSVYDDGLAWLDELAGEKLSAGEKVVEFSDDVWKSQTRKGTNVP